ncbi:MAG TPA: thiamine pyrophosphate-dependent enzyme, partial [Micromonosporaceae bacterium]|nr:thiamine pyrophosphate-dependent enzyme [Micromonosporaceae bacterium]
KVGVCLAASGSGAINLVTALAAAAMDSVPIVAITGQVARQVIGSDAAEEADIQGITMPVTKHNYLVQTAAEVPRVLAEAFHLAATGRPGPVLVDIPKDVLRAQIPFAWPPTLDLPGYRPTLHPHGKQIREAARLIAVARKPVFYVGGGVLSAGAAEGLRALAELADVPVVTTLTAQGAFPDSHRQHLGMPGRYGTVAAVYALQKADLVVALGARFSDQVTGRPDSFAPAAAVVHADIDPAEIGKNRAVDVPIVGHARHVVDELIAAVTVERSAASVGDRTQWWAQLDDLRRRYPAGHDEPADGALAAPYVVKRLGEIAGPDAVYVAGGGRPQLWAAQFISYDKPRSWLTSGGLGTTGYAVPAALGARVGRPESVVWAIDGAGGFQATSQELAACAAEGVPIKVALLNDGTAEKAGRRIPDFAMLAEALGCTALRCETAADVDKTIEAAMAVTDAPVVVDFLVGADVMGWPAVSAGTSDDEIMFARGMRPAFDEDDV